MFANIMEQAKTENWNELSIGKRLVNFASCFLEFEYKGGTLENPEKEICTADFTGLDCVTLFENALCMARILRKGNTDYDSFIEELTFTRYRGGELTDYTSRLHYTSDWIFDNTQKKVVRDVTKELGGVKFPIQVSFMSEHPGSYSSLKAHPEFVTIIEGTEKSINSRENYYYIPRARISEAEPGLQDGDIIAVATTIAGLDYSHTGIILVDEEGNRRFLHASSKHKKVLIDNTISNYVNSVKSHAGISVVRPLEVD